MGRQYFCMAKKERPILVISWQRVERFGAVLKEVCNTIMFHPGTQEEKKKGTKGESCLVIVRTALR